VVVIESFAHSIINDQNSDALTLEGNHVANFQKSGRNIHGETLTVSAAQFLDIELWGPLDMRSVPPTELTVSVSSPAPHITVKQANMMGNARVWRISGFIPGGQVTIEAKDSGGAVWSWVKIETAVLGLNSSVVTRHQLEDAQGVVQPKFPPSPAIQGLISLLTKATNNALHAGLGLLEAGGRSGNLYEHTAGLALDIFRLSTDPDEQRQGHNLVRFFITTRKTLGWKNMFYEMRGFTQTGPVGGSPEHFNHVHIDWLDFSKLVRDQSEPWNRAKWTQITYPPEALNSAAVDNEANESMVSEAWNNTSSPALTDAEILTLYS
jgi:hypothetical protein